MAFILRMRARGVGLAVLRALETVPRLAFVPHRYADLALRDMALPIACGQTMSEPFALAKALEALDLSRGNRVLEVGAGSGYATALLARLAGELVSYERYRTLAIEAGLRLRRLEIGNVQTIWGDGLDLSDASGLFDRIFVDGSIAEEQAPLFLERLAEKGVLIASLRDGPLAGRLVRIAHSEEGFARTDLGPSRAAPLMTGVSRAL